MTLLVEKGTFTKTTSTGVPVSQQVTLSNGSLTPKLLILWTNGQTTINGSYTDDARLSYGFSDGTNDACQAYRVDESLELESYTFRNDSIISIIDLTTNAIVSQADVSAFAAGSFTLNWSVQSNTEALHIHYIVAGGTDITNVSCVSVPIGDFATGNHSYNGSGTTFTPDFALTMTGSDPYGLAQFNTLASSNDRALFCIGAAKSTSEQCVMWGRDETVGTSDCDTYINSSGCLSAADSTTGAVAFLANLVSFNNAAGGGITVNITSAGDNECRLAFLLIKGGVWDCGTFQQRSGTGTQDVTLDTGLDPALVFLGGINSATSAAVVTNNYIGIGASDGTNESCSFSGNTDGLAVFAAVHTNTNTKVYRMATPNATAASSTTNAECDMNDMATPGKFQLNWTTADSTLRQMAFWVLGPTAAAGNAIERSLATETVSLSDSRERLAAKIRTRTDTAITVAETRARLSAKMRPLTTQTVALSENTIRVKGKVKSLTTETITVAGGTIAKLLAKIRTASDSTTVSETRNRLAAKNKTLATQTTALSESSIRIKGKLKSLATETITVGGGTLTRLSTKIRAISLETIALIENRTRLKGSIRALATQSAVLSENVARVVARQVIRALAAQTVALSEGVARLKASQRTTPQTIAITDNRARLSTKLRTIALQTVTLSESRTRIKGTIKTISQTITLSENITRRLAKLRALSTQTVALADNVTRQIIGGAVEITRVLTQTVVLSESVARLKTQRRILIENVSKAESLARTRGVARTLSQAVLISDILSRIKSGVKTISQTVLTSDSITKRMVKIRTSSQTIFIADNAVAETVGNLVRALVETITVSDSIVRRTVKLVILVQSIAIAEQASRLSKKMRIIPAQTIILVDATTAEINVLIKHAIRILSQATDITESLTLYVTKASQRFRRILQPSQKRLISNHPAYFLGTRGMHNDYEEY